MPLRISTVLVLIGLCLLLHVDAPAAVVGVEPPLQINSTSGVSATEHGSRTAGIRARSAPLAVSMI